MRHRHQDHARLVPESSDLDSAQWLGSHHFYRYSVISRGKPDAYECFVRSQAMELLVEKVISSAGQPIGPGDALRRIFEAIASGIFLPGNPPVNPPNNNLRIECSFPSNARILGFFRGSGIVGPMREGGN